VWYSVLIVAAVVAAFAEFVSLLNDYVQTVGHEAVRQVTN